MAPRCSEIVPRRSFLKENLLALHHACPQAKIFHRKLAVLVPIQMGQVVAVSQEPERILPKWKMAWSNVAFSQKVRVLSGSLLVERSDARGAFRMRTGKPEGRIQKKP